MKKFIFIGMIMMANVIFAQTEPQLEIVGQLVKATYYNDNGSVAQQGYFKDGKLEGKWVSYNQDGTVKDVAEFSNGMKVGKWISYNNDVVVNEVVYNDNQIVSVTNYDKNYLAKN
jgi:antitoxin component YwqK of YwqJK toxin-antitoxin module